MSEVENETASQSRPPTPDSTTTQTTPLAPILTIRKEPKNLNANSDVDSSSSSSMQLDLVSSRICQVIIPVTLCSLYVVILIRILEWGADRSDTNFIGSTWDQLGLGVDQDLTFSKTLLNNTIIVGMFVLLIAIVTIFILFIFYMGWHSCLSYYFYIPSFIIMAILTPVYFKEILASLNWFGLDLISLVMMTWNFVALGMVAIFEVYTKGPLFVQQFYLIHNSAILAVVIIKALPSWAPWMLLIFLVFWDLFAVLAPYGPLNLIISMAEREGIIEMPGLLYATDITASASSNQQLEEQQEQRQRQQQKQATGQQGNSHDKSNGRIAGPISKSPGEERLTSRPEVVGERQVGGVSDNNDKQEEKQKAPLGEKEEEEEEEEEEKEVKRKKRDSMQEKGVNIGLGDFIFYSLLVGLNAKGRQMEDFYSILASLDAILVGLVLTLVILAVTRRALPALPISIALGLLVSVATIYFVPALSNKLATEQIFI